MVNNLNKLIDTRHEYQSKLKEILRRYGIKFIKRLYEGSTYKEFQQDLLNLIDWPEDKKRKEYLKFLKHTNDKYDLSEDELSTILGTIFELHLKIMTSLFDEIELTIPKFDVFWFKTLKRMAKYYFESTKSALENHDSRVLDEAVEHVIQKFIPLKEIIKCSQKELDHYSFNKSSTFSNVSNNSNAKGHQFDVALESESNSDALRCIRSEDFENEYYNSDQDKSNEQKLITIQKNKVSHKK